MWRAGVPALVPVRAGCAPADGVQPVVPDKVPDSSKPFVCREPHLEPRRQPFGTFFRRHDKNKWVNCHRSIPQTFNSVTFFVQSAFDNLVYRVHKDEIHLLAQVFGHVIEVVLVLFRKDDRLDACAPGREHLSFTPPMGMTLPRSVISPVMARSCFTIFPVSRDTSAVVMVTPADGPSLGIAPAGTMDVDVRLVEKVFADAELLGLGTDIGKRRLG